MSEIARHYDASKNPGSEAYPASIPGVPLADLDQATWDALPEYVQADVDASPMYRKTKPPTNTKRSVRADTDDTDRHLAVESANVVLTRAAPAAAPEKSEKET